MKATRPTFLPLPNSLGFAVTLPGAAFGWHTHPFDELCLVDETPTTIGHAGQQQTAAVGTLFLFKQGERHGYWNQPSQCPRLWVIHYHGDDAINHALPELTHRDPAKRVWRLSPDRIETFKAIHQKIILERTRGRRGNDAAQSAWLRLLLIAAARWSESVSSADAVLPKLADAELLELWRIIHDYAGEPDGLVDQIRAHLPNYDSLRHRFRKAAGESPVRLWAKLRMQQARNLLLESNLSVKEIAVRIGYARQHEFARAFRKQFGMSPTDWRSGAFHVGETTFHAG